jgi:hypothetical protein
MSIEFWLRLAAIPVAIAVWVALGYVLAPVSKAVKRWIPDGKLKRFLLTPAGARWGSKQPSDAAVLPDRNERVVERLPPPLQK